MIGNGEIGANAVSQFGAITSLSIENAKVMEGVTFSASKRFSVPLSGEVNFVFDPTVFNVGNNKIVLLPLKFKAYGAGPINIDIYVDPVYTGGTNLPSINRDLTNSSISQMRVIKDPAITNDGTLLPNDFVILSNGTSAVASIGGESSDDLVLNLDLSKKYLAKLTNTEANAATAHMSTSWFELVL